MTRTKLVSSSATPTDSQRSECDKDERSASDDGVTAEPAASYAAVGSPPLVHNELLYFLVSTFDGKPASQIKQTILDFYREDEVLYAKQKLVQSVDEMAIAVDVHSYTRRRMGEHKIRTSIDDIFSIFVAVDETGARDSLPRFCAVEHSRVPFFSDDISDVAFIRLQLQEMRERIDVLSNLISVQNTKNLIANCVPTQTVAVQTSKSVAVKPDYSSDINTNCVPILTAAEQTVQSVTSPPDNSSVTAAEDVADDTFAGVARRNVASVGHGSSQREPDFRLVEYKKKNRPKKIVIGSRNDAPAVQGVKKKSVICVGRLHKDTSTDALSSFLSSNGISVVSCYLAKLAEAESDDTENAATRNTRRAREFVSMRVCVYQTDMSKIMCADLWPEGVTVRPWVFKNKA